MSIEKGKFMIEKCFFVLVFLSIGFGSITGHMPEVANAALDGTSKAVGVIISLCGTMCLWNGVMEVLKEGGAIGALSKVMSPLLAKIFPDTWKRGCGKDEVLAAICANILGIGNAATPLALSAMKKMHDGAEDKTRATDDMVTFAALGAASLDIMPTTLIALRRAAGSTEPYSVIVPIWICSLTLSALTVILCRSTALLSRALRQRKERRCRT